MTRCARTKRKLVVTTDSRHSLPVAPDLVQRRFTPEVPNQLWSGDITYIATDEGWLYLAAVIDLFSRQVVGWSLQPHMPAGLVKDALAMAWWRRRPQPGLIFHSDRGSPVLQRRIPGCFERLEDSFLDEQEGQLLGQRTDRVLLGPAENGQRAWAQVHHPRAGQTGCDGLDGFLQGSVRVHSCPKQNLELGHPTV